MVTSHSCCTPLALAVHPSLLLFTPHYCCTPITLAVHPSLLLYTHHSYCSPLPLAVHLSLLLFTSHSCCSPLILAVHISLLLFTSHSCCSPLIFSLHVPCVPHHTTDHRHDQTKEMKTVTFREDRTGRCRQQQMEETPLMFSRSSSIGSLSSFDAQSVHSSLVSEYSWRTSQMISPSELPDSPSESMPTASSYDAIHAPQSDGAMFKIPRVPPVAGAAVCRKSGQVDRVVVRLSFLLCYAWQCGCVWCGCRRLVVQIRCKTIFFIVGLISPFSVCVIRWFTCHLTFATHRSSGLPVISPLLHFGLLVYLSSHLYYTSVIWFTCHLTFTTHRSSGLPVISPLLHIGLLVYLSSHLYYTSVISPLLHIWFTCHLTFTTHRSSGLPVFWFTCHLTFTTHRSSGLLAIQSNWKTSDRSRCCLPFFLLFGCLFCSFPVFLYLPSFSPAASTSDIGSMT